MRRLSILVLLLLASSSAFAVDVGDTRSFWGWDLSEMPPADREFTATCRGVGEHGYVWVEDAVWNDHMNADDVEDVLAAWDDQTPADDSAGIYETVTGAMGQPPDAFDDDPAIHLVYYDIGEYEGYTFDGFFRADDQGSGPTSNQVEMLHLNSANDPGSAAMLAVEAHEFTHLIIYNYDPNESSWVQESLAEAAMVLCGWYTDEAWVEDFASAPETALIPPDAYSLNYGAALLFGTYLMDRYGESILGDLVADTASGVDGVESVLADYDESLSFSDLIGQWTAANYADLDGDDEYGFSLLDVPRFSSEFSVVGEANAFEVPAWATGYLRFAVSPGDYYEVTVDSADAADLRVHLIEMDGELDAAYSVEEMTGGEQTWSIAEGAFAVVAVAYAADGANAEGTVTLTPTEATDDDDDDAAGDDDSDSGDDDDDSGGCG